MKLVRASSRRATASAVLAVTAIMAAGCARFDDSASTPFSPEPSFGAAEIDPVDPDAPPTSTSAAPGPPPGPCVDPDPNVIATCLDTTGGLVMLPGGASALIGERRTGRIVQVAQGQQPTEVARVDVDASGDGGLLDLALSPSYAEDGLIYAYITTGSDNRVVRIAAGDTPKPVLTGIPRGQVSNRGAIEFSSPSQMLVLTGDAGNPAAATDPASLSGKLLRVDSLTPSANPPAPAVALSGIGTAGDVCTDQTGSIWVTDRTAVEDRLQRIDQLGTVVSPVWTWPDRPGVAGCAAGPGTVAIALTTGKAVAVLATDENTGAVTAAPSLVAQDRYGQLNGAAISGDGTIWAGTVNKNGDAPGPNDDRVVKIPVPAGGGGFD
ncbi:PQQ-dependent sugar dehydrogenase [Rhodococcus sp. BP-252]|uniref:Oxidoreductase n=1 Tax=Rhodococcoides kyotonense TaxID=398843 RepID=A0A177YAY1_9NOCA|nr:MULTISPECIES: PQQ-dependent sugar dehydrogenase [Rhodococcus]MBY6411190.1 PQQ-dependent sugar dehydrogenase [Rhodococcus sp. BP-320]MBY6415849.1 PQQ-dependent sugar dehydrogenase [Rhodococcus sp. BP-321]MBY6423655.1 PQQ-dependent sugar dehydrogenase [Rhodococcus sp. BP-324]MBY6425824.1 PQQ-dependent sugar dehydrogenase [Rhodococcus sp. BP-323]MBY6431055.1 PQQ-dependent sugar dehydrogenase [Rhodococcus sp. BP-322]